MTEKEFENLKVGDKVWVIPWFKDESVFQGTIGKIGRYNENTSNKWVSVGESKAYTYPPEYVFQTKVEALQQVVKNRETSVIASRCMLQSDEDELAEAKKELTKAKEEEKKMVWVARLFIGDVYEAGQDEGNRLFGVEGYSCHKTKQEAYSALAEYYKGKHEEALAKACDVRYCVSDKVIMFHDCCEAGKSDSDGEFYVRGKDYEGYDYCVKKSSCFPTRQEAEAELERRKK